MLKEMNALHFDKILVVDDTTANLQLLTNLLTEHGYTVYPASTGELALEFVRSTLPDLVLLDIRMPQMDGFKVCRRLKADERTRAIPVILISILEDEGEKVKGFQAGAVDYITKPFQAEEVLARVKIHLRVRALTERLEQTVRERTGKLTLANQRLQEEIAERREAEEKVRQNLAQQKALLCVYQNMATAPVPDIVSFAVDRCVNLTESAIGFVGLISDDDRQMEAHIWSESVMENCPINKPLAFPISEAGLWAEPIRQRRLIIVNDYGAPNAYKKGCPEGHLELSRFMGVPVVDQGRVVAVAGVANRRKKYTESDHYKVSLLLEGMWEIIKRKRAEEELRKLNDELEQRVTKRTAELEATNREMHDFTYTVSHDLRAPLRHIDGFLELLQKKAGTVLDKQSRHYMETISSAARKMGLLIDDLLSFSRMGRHVLSLEQVDLRRMVRDLIRELEPHATGRTIDWRIGDLPGVQGDAAMLRMVLTNLVSNALKFTRPRQEARIEIGSQPEQNADAVIFVRDNGVGFDMAYADKLFGVFQRLHRAEEFEGSGIGLANARRIIARHGGRIWAEGSPDQGATFYFSLPRSIQGA
jgi:signal transduction histidine kinase/DNA-binding response OmpR family regulator